MAVIGEHNAAVPFREFRLYRGKLLTSTALQAVFLCMVALPAAAQPAPNARPVGGQVVAGSAAIGGTATTTTIDQTSQRAAIDWKSFDVGRNQTVTFHQPLPSSMTLNRVTGPDPSAIAGRITANGGIVVTNQSGVVFYSGAQVEATNLVVSAPGITNKNFMNGKLVFDQAAKPGAAVVNQGNITIKQAGLGALVAPQVRNAGTITAKLGHVVLAGAEAATLDMYGDGLVAVDVTKRVTKTPDGSAALVTNTGTIVADGGTVQLTAAAVDDVVKTLVQAGGKISAQTVGSQTGTITIGGTGGALVVEGTLATVGRRPGTTGGAIEIAGTGDVRLASTARINASGRAGGGTIAVGTTIARATGGRSTTPKVVAQNVSVTKGARVAADAGSQGTGGTVTLLSTNNTTFDGVITARGGKASGDGGFVELSGKNGVGLTGSVDVSAAHGKLGNILLDPTTLNIIGQASVGGGSADAVLIANNGTLLADDPNATGAQTLTNTAIQSLNGNIQLQATTGMTVSAPITLTIPGQSLTMQSGGNLTVNAPISAAGAVTLQAAFQAATGVLTLNSSVTSTASSVSLSGAAINLSCSVSVSAINVGLQTNSLSIGFLSSVGSPVGTSGTVAIAPFTAGNTLSIDAAQGEAPATLSLTPALLAQVTARGGTLALGSVDGGVTTTAGAITINTPLNMTGIANTLGLYATGPIGQSAAGDITAQTLIGAAQGPTLNGSLTLPNAGNTIGNIGPFSTNGNVTLATGQPLVVSGVLQAGNGSTVILQSDNISIPSPINAPGGTVELAPLTFGHTLSIDTTTPAGNPPTNLSLLTGDLENIHTAGGTLRIGLTDTQGTVAGAITINGSLDLASVAGALALESQGAITETTGVLLNVGNLTASAGDQIRLANANTIGSLGSVNAGNNFGVGDSSIEVDVAGDLVVNGPVFNFSCSGIGAPITIRAGRNLTVDANEGPPIESTGAMLLAAGVSDPTGALTINGSVQSRFGGMQLSAAGGGMQINAQVSAGTNNGEFGAPGQVLSIRSDGQLVFGEGGVLFADGGAIEIAPTTAGVPMTIGGVGAGLSLASIPIGTDEGNNGTPVLLRIGGLGGGLDGLGTPQAGSVTFASNPFLTNPALQTLELDASGLVSEQAGAAITNVNFLTGTAGAFNLGSGGNQIPDLLDLTATSGDLVLTDATALVILRPVQAGDGRTLSLTAPSIDVAGPAADFAGSLLVLPDATANPPKGGNILLTTDSLVATGAMQAPSGLVAIAPLTPGNTLSFDTIQQVTPGVLSLFPALLAEISTNGGTLALGSTSAGASTTAGAISINAPLDLTGIAGTLGLYATGLVTQSAGSAITAGTLIGPAIAPGITPDGAVTLAETGNTIGSLGPFAVAGDFLLNDNSGLTVVGALDPGNVTINTNGNLVIAESITGNTVSLTAGGAISEVRLGRVQAQLLTGSAQSAAFTNPNAVDALGTFKTTSGFALNNQVPLTVTGPVSDGAFINLTNQGAVTLAGDVTAPGVGLVVNNGGITQPSGTLKAGTLTGSATSAAFTDGQNTITTLGGFSTTNGFTLANTVPLTVAGPVSDGAFINLTNQGAVTLAGDVTAPGVGLVVNNGGITQPSGALTAGTLTGSATLAALTGSNTVTTLGGFKTTNGFTLVNTVPLTVAGPVSDGAFINLTNQGAVTLAGDVTAPGVGLVVNNGGITQPSGTLKAGTLTGSATSAALTGQNTITTLGGFSTTNGFTLANTVPLTVTGPVSDGAFINITNQGAVTLAGDVTAPGVGLVVNNGGITQTSGTLTAGTLTGSASGDAQFGAGTGGAVTSVQTLGSFSTPNGTLSLSDSESLTVTGPLTAQDFNILAPGQITLSGGTITTTGLPAASQIGSVPADPGSFFLVQAAGGTGTFMQTGVTTIQSFAGTTVTVRIDVPPAGRISLNDLVAREGSIVLGVVSGTAIGTINVGNLLVLGQTGSSNLFGSVQGRQGSAAAVTASIQPAINRNYLLNNCIIALATCTIAPVVDLVAIARNTPPTTVLPWAPIAFMAGDNADLVPQVVSSGRVRPQTLNLGLNFRPVEPRESNPELVLPNVSGRDY